MRPVSEQCELKYLCRTSLAHLKAEITSFFSFFATFDPCLETETPVWIPRPLDYLFTDYCIAEGTKNVTKYKYCYYAQKVFKYHQSTFS